MNDEPVNTTTTIRDCQEIHLFLYVFPRHAGNTKSARNLEERGGIKLEENIILKNFRYFYLVSR